MEIKLKNIGIIQESELNINGMTVITGKNNSGKTTVGKTLYSIIEATSSISSRYENDRYRYIRNRLSFVTELMDSIKFYINIMPEEVIESALDGYPLLHSLYTQQYVENHDSKQLEEYVKNLIKEINSIDDSIFADGLHFEFVKRSYLDRYNMTIQEAFNKQRIEAIRALEQMLEDINKDPEQTNYIRESITQMLRVEFSDQIQPVKNKESESYIALYDKERVYYHIKIKGDRVEKSNESMFYSSPFRRALLIDNPNIIDNPSESGMRIRRKINEQYETILNPLRFALHNERMTALITKHVDTTVLEQTILDEKLEPIREKINAIIPGTYEFGSNGGYYIQNGTKLSTANLATGSKLFSIIKILLDRGYLQEGTLLILDEPEAHLHPQWQNALAEIIVLLVKELKTKVVLTSHSPNFVLAIDAYMRKYKIEQITNFYQTQSLENGMVKYHCVNNDLSAIYQDFLNYLADVKVLRDSYLEQMEQI